MCEPTTIMAVAAVASAAVGTYTAVQTANTQAKVAKQQADNQREEAQAQADQQAGERVKQARRERARMLVAAGESGLQGQSFEVGLIENFARQNDDMAAIARQTGFTSRAIDSSLASNLAGINKPNALSAGLQIAQAGVSGYQLGGQIKTAYNDFKIGQIKPVTVSSTKIGG